MILVSLFISFVIIGAFSFGGGYAALPLIQNQIVSLHHWLSPDEFNHLITISQMTPGPIAINSATFVGLKIDGIAGAVTATLGCVLPSCIIVTLLAYFYLKYRDLSVIRTVLGTLRPAVIALIATAGLAMLIPVIFQDSALRLDAVRIEGIVLFLGCLWLLRKKRCSPILVMVLAGVPYFLFESNQILSITFACIVLVIGLTFILSMAMMGNPYRKLKSERLLFDPVYYSELSSAREAQKKKSLVFIIIAICLILVAGISGMFAMPTFPISEIQCILVACSVYLFIYVIGISDNYDILVNSEERMETIYWRIVKKIKK